MKRILLEPQRLLEAYNSHLSESGGILSESLNEILNLMSSANQKLVPKCISLSILSSSTPEIQLEICRKGAWDILLKWLQEALKEDNFAFLLELLKLYHQLPVRLEQLTQNVCPKLINSLTKRCDNEEVKAIASEIVKKWKEVISLDSRKMEQPRTKKPKLDQSTKPVVTKDVVIAELHQKDEKKRRTTVKMPPTHMRTAGLEDISTQPQPKSRVDVTKKSKLEDIRPQIEHHIESFHQKITVTPTEPRKVPELHESSDFINALTTTNPNPVVRKKRKLQIKHEPSVTSETNIKLDSSLDTSANSLIEETSIVLSPKTLSSKKSSLSNLFSVYADEDKPKKRVSWAEEDKLQVFHYFELDESERVNVNRISIEDSRRREHFMERQHFKRPTDDALIGFQQWYPPQPLERLYLVEQGYKSVEKQEQLDRERYVLQAIYFTKESIPDSPEEPDSDTIECKPSIDIPLEDLTIYDSDHHHHALDAQSEKLLVMKDGFGNSQISLNPEVANLVKSLAANLTSADSEPSLLSSVLITGPNHHHNSSQPPTNPMTPTLPTYSVLEVPFDQSNELPEQTSPISSPNQMLQNELWDVLEHNYPELNVHDLSAERIRELLEPLKDQLVSKGIFHFRNSNSALMPRPPPPHHHQQHQGYNPRPSFRNPPPDFVSQRPMQNGRMCAPSSFSRPPFCGPMHYPRQGQPQPPKSYRPPGPPSRGGRSSNRKRSSQPCRFFQQGSCRNGPACTFTHVQR